MIRPGRDEDAPGYIALIAACWGEYPGNSTDVLADSPEIAALASHIAAKNGALWTAEADGAVVGMVATYPDAAAWHLARMYVAAGQRGTGLGVTLLQAAEAHARATGASRMVLWSDVTFTRAHAFYEKHGYVREGGLRALPAYVEAGYAKPLAGRVVARLDVAAAQSAERGLARLQDACAPAARDAWPDVTRAVGRCDTALFAAWRDGVLAGSLQLAFDPAADGAHRAELRGLLVAPGSKCRGLTRRLLAAAEEAAWQAGRTLLTFPVAADEHAETLYRELGWQFGGEIAGYWPGQALRLYSKQLAAETRALIK